MCQRGDSSNRSRAPARCADGTGCAQYPRATGRACARSSLPLQRQHRGGHTARSATIVGYKSSSTQACERQGYSGVWECACGLRCACLTAFSIAVCGCSRGSGRRVRDVFLSLRKSAKHGAMGKADESTERRKKGRGSFLAQAQLTQVVHVVIVKHVEMRLHVREACRSRSRSRRGQRPGQAKPPDSACACMEACGYREFM